jgi:acyl-CoA thioesterase-2
MFLVAIDSVLGSAIFASLDRLLRALDLEPLGDDRFRIPSESGTLFDHVYGGQLLAEALTGAAATVTGKEPCSLHAAFVKAGTPGRSREVVVDRVRDGRAMSTRRVEVSEEGRTLLVALASFHANGTGPDVAVGPPPAAPPPEELPLLQEWAGEHGRHWIERPPPLEVRMSEAPTFLSGTSACTPRAHWMRVPRDVGDDPVLHAALLAYASDFFLMDMVFRAHPAGLGPGSANGMSLDHAIWFHRPVRFDRWHLHTQEAITVVGDRGLARGAIHDADGRLAASVVQEVLVLPVVAG